MGNSGCSLDRHILALSFKSKTDFTLQTPTEEPLKSNGSQNILSENEDLNQCSPSSKFNFNFLNSSIRASVHSDGQGDCKKRRETKIKKITGRKSQMVSSIRRSLIQWQENKLSNMLKELMKNEQVCMAANNVKLQSIRSYFDFILKKEKTKSKFSNVKITGDAFLKIRQQSINPYYKLSKKIGEGAFGSVYIGKCLATGQIRAVKILKKKAMNENDEKSLWSQINILKKMDHINIIKLYDVFYFNNFFFVVTEFCEGGSLLDALRTNQISSEKDIVTIIKQLISAVSYIHQMKIAHRDLKLQNIVLVKQLSKSKKDQEKIFIKLIDFGLAQQVAFTYHNKSRLVGTLDYMAPEIFNGYFSTYSDIWSCGIILCMLLIGSNPFRGKSRDQTIQKIKSLEINYKKNEWGKVSQKAKDLVSQMLIKKQEKRISIEQILNHDWIKYNVLEVPNQMRSEFVIKSLNNFNRGSNFICYIKNFLISRELTQETRQQLAMIFEKVDRDASGVIQKQELIQLYSLVNGASDGEVQNIIDKMDQNKSGGIDFQQFLICMTKNEILRNKTYINKAFDFLDEDRTGYIEKHELIDFLQGCEQEQLYNILAEADFDGDSRISREEFLQYLMNVQL